MSIKHSNRVLAVAAAASLAVTGLLAVSATSAQAASTVKIETDFTGQALNDLQAEFNHWTKTSGVTVNLVGDTNFPTDIVTQVKTHQTPNIAIWAQPGGLLAQSSAEIPLDSILNVKAISAAEIPGAAFTKNGHTYGILWSANLKSLLWYNKAAFAAHGYTVPKTYADLVALTSKIISDGSGYPFCVGGGSGWPLTDWMEQYVADLDGVTTYNNWITGKVHFSDASITKAATALSNLLLQDGASNGNGAGIANDPYNNTAPLFSTGGKAAGECFMYKQGSFASGFFPANIQAEINNGDASTLDVTAFPTVTGGSSVIEGGGNVVAAFSKDAATVKTLNFMLSSNFGHYFAGSSSGFFLSPFKNFDTSYYPNPFRAKFATVLQSAKNFVFDASDQMPPAVNTAFGNEFVAWFGGKEDYATAAKNIDAAYNG